eukprot:SAG11_NODE_235_length_11852_cov_4.266020_3_plen_238_part_00
MPRFRVAMVAAPQLLAAIVTFCGLGPFASLVGALAECPPGSYDYSTGFIFCFETSKLYGGGDAAVRPSTVDDVAFRVTYGRQFDLRDGWNRYTVQLPEGAREELLEEKKAAEYNDCMNVGLGDAARCQARVAWTRKTHTISADDTDDDWRYESDETAPGTENDIPGIFRLQHPEVFAPMVVNPTCIPCPPCAECNREGTATIKAGWGLGATQQHIYRGLLRGSAHEFKTLANRLGSA